MESYNAILIQQDKPQSERLQFLNQLVTRQLEAILEIEIGTIKRLVEYTRHQGIPKEILVILLYY